MKHAVLINYNFDPQDWWLDYGYKPENVIVYDRSDDGIERTFAARTYKTQNIGDVDFDKLSYLVENYDNLPDTFLLSKTNLFKFITKEEWEKVADNKDYTPLLTKNHKTYSDKLGVVCKYEGEIYAERADSWFFNAGLDRSGRFSSWQDWALAFGLPLTPFIPFAPGGSYILTKERVHRYSKDFYERMRVTLPYALHPVEAHCCERSYHQIWR